MSSDSSHQHRFDFWTCSCGEVEDMICECGVTRDRAEIDQLRALLADVRGPNIDPRVAALIAIYASGGSLFDDSDDARPQLEGGTDAE